VITFATALFDGKDNVPKFARGIYTPEWADKLWRGIHRWYSKPFRMVVLSSHTTSGQYDEDIDVIDFLDERHDWLDQMEFYRPDLQLGQMILLGLDTVITGPLDDLVEYAGEYIVPRDPYFPKLWCNGITGCSQSRSDMIWDRWVNHRGEIRLMCGKLSQLNWLRDNLGMEPDLYDDLTPGQVVSYPCHVTGKMRDACEARVVYFHGESKPHNATVSWVVDNWI